WRRRHCDQSWRRDGRALCDHNGPAVRAAPYVRSLACPPGRAAALWAVFVFGTLLAPRRFGSFPLAAGRAAVADASLRPPELSARGSAGGAFRRRLECLLWRPPSHGRRDHRVTT